MGIRTRGTKSSEEQERNKERIGPNRSANGRNKEEATPRLRGERIVVGSGRGIRMFHTHIYIPVSSPPSLSAYLPPSSIDFQL